MLHLHFSTRAILALFLTACEHLCRLEHVLDLSPIDVHFGKSVEVFTCHSGVRTQELLPDVSPGFSGQIGVIYGYVDSRVKGLVNILDSVRCEEEHALVIFLPILVSCVQCMWGGP